MEFHICKTRMIFCYSEPNRIEWDRTKYAHSVLATSRSIQLHVFVCLHFAAHQSNHSYINRKFIVIGVCVCEWFDNYLFGEHWRVLSSWMGRFIVEYRLIDLHIEEIHRTKCMRACALSTRTREVTDSWLYKRTNMLMYANALCHILYFLLGTMRKKINKLKTRQRTQKRWTIKSCVQNCCLQQIFHLDQFYIVIYFSAFTLNALHRKKRLEKKTEETKSMNHLSFVLK